MPLTLPDLPFARGALAPHISAETLDYHHGKHHRAYVDTTNKLIAGTPLENRPLEAIIAEAHKQGDQTLFNQAAQVWNHGFFWQCLTPDSAPLPSPLRDALNQSFGGLSQFRTAFSKAAKGEFGSGWTWLISDDQAKLDVISTSDADTPIVHGQTPLLCLDVWEHAYYIDYRNDRGAFIDAFFDHLINWRFATRNLDGATAARETPKRRAGS